MIPADDLEDYEDYEERREMGLRDGEKWGCGTASF